MVNRGQSTPNRLAKSGSIVFQEYGLQYRRGLDWALKEISLSVNEREKVNITSEHIVSYLCFIFYYILSNSLNLFRLNCGKNRGWKIISCSRNLPDPWGGKRKDLHRWDKHCRDWTAWTEVTYHHYPTGTTWKWKNKSNTLTNLK